MHAHSSIEEADRALSVVNHMINAIAIVSNDPTIHSTLLPPDFISAQAKHRSINAITMLNVEAIISDR